MPYRVDFASQPARIAVLLSIHPGRYWHRRDALRDDVKMSSAQIDVCFLSSAHPVDDKRVFQKEARSLAEAGWSVVHLAPGTTNSSWEEHGVLLRTYPAGAGKTGRLRRLGKLYRLARGTGARAYHCNEVDSWAVGLLLKRRATRIVFDAHEHYPPSVVRWLPAPMHTVGAGAVRILLQLMGLLTDRIVLAKASISDDYSKSAARQVIVRNATRATGTPDPIPDVETVPLRLVHTGLFSRARGSIVLADALGKVTAAGHEVEVVVIGRFNDDSEPEFDAMTAALGVKDRVIKLGWLSYDDAFDALQTAHVGLVLFTKHEENNARAMPHKMFDYMLAGLAVVAQSCAPEVSEILDDAGCAVLVDADSPEDVASAIAKLAQDRALTADLGARGRRAAIERYSWEREAEELKSMYQELLGAPDIST
jgi:glycosyltransferase involved in cell wall biosynthesis